MSYRYSCECRGLQELIMSNDTLQPSASVSAALRATQLPKRRKMQKLVNSNATNIPAGIPARNPFYAC